MVENIVLAYSGGLDTSVAVHWLSTHHDADVTTLLLDMGQPSRSLKEAQDRALANGATDCVVSRVREPFAGAYVAPAIQANALYEDAYPLATALSRPLIASELVRVAQEIGADAIAHGCTGKGNDQVRIETSVKALAPGLTCLAPQRTDAMTRDQAIAYAEHHALQLPELTTSAFSTDENLWGRSVEGGAIEDLSQPVPEDAYAWTVAQSQAPDEAGIFTLTFQHGVPVALDGKQLHLADLSEQLNQLSGAHGIGRIDLVENRLVGIKSREIYEAPAAVTVYKAKAALEQLALPRDTAHFKRGIEQKFAQLTYDGLWHSPTMAGLQAFTGTIQEAVTGEVTLQAYKGNLNVQARTAEASLYDDGLATYGKADAFDHEAATGFIHLHSLPLATLARARVASGGTLAAEAGPL